MKRKFGGYTIEVKNIYKRKTVNNGIYVTLQLVGDIEIGIHVDANTWRGDQILKYVFKDEYTNYRIINLHNNLVGNCNEVSLLVEKV